MKIDTIEQKGRPAEILLVEDNHGDVLLTLKAFKQAQFPHHVTVAKNGEEAVKILRHLDEYATAATPDLVLLDLNLPKKSGKEVLQEIKSDEGLRHIPVIVLTSSRAELDVVKTYELHANSYIIKPVSLEKFIGIVATIGTYWFTTVVLSDQCEPKKI